MIKGQSPGWGPQVGLTLNPSVLLLHKMDQFIRKLRARTVEGFQLSGGSSGQRGNLPVKYKVKGFQAFRDALCPIMPVHGKSTT